MTEPEDPAGTRSGNPTPEEISARLEALLKRTHAMRAEKAAAPASTGVTWPPSERELNHYDVVHVGPDNRPSPAAAASAPAAAVETAPPTGKLAASHVERPAAPTEFARPDWGELRLRQEREESRGTRWLPLVAGLLALAVLGQAAYIWSLSSPPAVDREGRLQVNGPQGADVRLDGQSIGIAPLDRAIEPGTYDVQVGSGIAAQRVTVEPSTKVVLLAAGVTELPQSESDAETAGDTPPPVADRPVATSATAMPSTGAPAAAPAAAAPVPATRTTADVSATRGAVRIESIPPGLPVTMEGRERGVTPITIGQLRPGRHDVLVGGLARKVDVAANEVTTLRVDRP